MRRADGTARRLRLSLLWILFAAGVASNAATSFADVSPLVPLSLGLLTTASGVALIAHYRRHRR
ncbi:hypothetical protein B0I33_10615 [Prauserella shujinwangii]|uniref:Uncharacterized protein n=1 Tax=Prauserella shujinwangii TaxID=1453103 RepID=A0A2T0LT49_9PSEU|nr:hypothetical protein B0I33_10615 [Prauserella shujinwangii]